MFGLDSCFTDVGLLDPVLKLTPKRHFERPLVGVRPSLLSDRMNNLSLFVESFWSNVASPHGRQQPEW